MIFMHKKTGHLVHVEQMGFVNVSLVTHEGSRFVRIEDIKKDYEWLGWL